MPAFSVLTVNIEGDNHLQSIHQLLLEKNPDIICLQEVFAVDMPFFQEVLKVRGTFVPLCRIESSTTVRLNSKGEWGIAIFSRLPITSLFIHPYQGTLNHVPVYQDHQPNSVYRALLVAKIQTEQGHFYTATTHFTWTDNGTVSELQHEHMRKVLSILTPYQPLVLCGDFNAPRGKAIFSQLAEKYVDHIPPDITTTIDQKLHRTQGIQLVVDGMFTTSNIQVHHTEVINGVSDHMAVFAQMSL